MASVLPVVLALAVIIGLSFLSYIVTPKGPQQTLIRTSAILTLVCCYLTWAITYLAQLHPLVAPIHKVAAEHHD